MAAFEYKEHGCDCRLLRCKLCNPEPSGVCCKWSGVRDFLPPVGKEVLVRGYYNEDDDTIYEEGYRSTVDRPLDLRNGEWVDFSFIVTHWVLIND